MPPKHSNSDNERNLIGQIILIAIWSYLIKVLGLSFLPRSPQPNGEQVEITLLTSV